jgi:hypothetical protein
VAWKHTWKFQSSNGGTWEEIWYREGGSSIEPELTLTTNLVNARLALLDGLNKWLVDVVSQVGGARMTGQNTINKPGTSVNPTTRLPQPAAIGWAAVVNCVGRTGGAKRWMLRGWSEGDYFRAPTTGVDTVLPGEQALLDNCLLFLDRNNFGILRLNPSTPVINPYLSISRIDGTAGDGTTAITVKGAAGFTTPARVIIGLASLKDTPGLRGHFQAISITVNAGPPATTTIVIPYRTPNNALVPNPVGRLRREDYAAVSVINNQSSDFSHVGTRTSRGGYRTSRGARRAARIRGLA